MLDTTSVLFGAVCGAVAYVLLRVVEKDAPMRHARYRMRAKMAQAILSGRACPVQVDKKGRVVVH